MSASDLTKQHYVQYLGEPSQQSLRPTLILGHGFGCDQQIWAAVAQILAEQYSLVLFDHMGCGRSDISAYDAQRYTSLDAYADDLVNLVQSLQLEQPVFIGHSVSGAIGWLASLKAPQLFSQIIAIGPSPRYLNDLPDYLGGFEEQDVQEMLDLMERNHFEWAGYLAPIVMGAADRPALAEELRQTFLNAEPAISRRFARATFMSDIRQDLPKVKVPTLILYCDEDVIVPLSVIEYLQRTLPRCSVKKLQASGHYPHISNPSVVAQAIIEGVLIVT